MKVPDGLYDNRKTMCREVWQKGKVTVFLDAKEIGIADPKTLGNTWNRPWGHYKDTPNAELRGK